MRVIASPSPALDRAPLTALSLAALIALTTACALVPVAPIAAQQARQSATTPRSSNVARPIARATPTSTSPSKGEPSLAAMRRATERFRDVRIALAEGYVRDPGNLCDNAEMMGLPAELGAMGIHFFRPDLLGITAPPSPRVNGTGTHTDFSKPAILIYEPQRDSSLALVAVENLVFIKAWEQAGNTAPPSFHGVPWDRMADNPATALDEAHMFEPHYDRHVWLYRENPKGIFAQFNPNVSCRYHTQQGSHKH